MRRQSSVVPAKSFNCEDRIAHLVSRHLPSLVFPSGPGANSASVITLPWFGWDTPLYASSLLPRSLLLSRLCGSGAVVSQSQTLLGPTLRRTPKSFPRGGLGESGRCIAVVCSRCASRSTLVTCEREGLRKSLAG